MLRSASFVFALALAACSGASDEGAATSASSDELISCGWLMGGTCEKLPAGNWRSAEFWGELYLNKYAAELEYAKVLDWYGIPWAYEPTTFVLDSTGHIRSVLRGPQTPTTLARAMASAEHVIRRHMISLHQVSDEPLKALQLRLAWMVDIEVADKADSDAVQVVLVAGGLVVSAPLLLGPARANFTLAVAGIGAVADDEVVATAIPTLDLAVLAVDLVVTSGGLGAVVDDDPLPGISLLGGGNPLGGHFIMPRRHGRHPCGRRAPA